MIHKTCSHHNYSADRCKKHMVQRYENSDRTPALISNYVENHALCVKVRYKYGQ